MKFLVTVLFATFLQLGAGNQLQACGSALTDILSLVCRNQFHDAAKRQYITGEISIQIILWIYKRERRFTAEQKRGGVVEECCFSSCSYENLLLYCSQSIDPVDVFAAARAETTTTIRPPTTRITTTAGHTTTITTTTNKPTASRHGDNKDIDNAAWSLTRRWFYVNRLGRFRGQVGRRIINM
ncbi:bombyxin-related peptide B-like [Saccostrea echinata]|uniref:bombyxin-related peptide B-like n=1 Tax=Saccostrea echinata TaxID=191078 RepID=UPI002A7F103D|nr:bombyxin-related peptide B-like [Saccostrea echinata]